MKEITEKRFCETCKKETVHTVSEDAFEIEYSCNECSQHQEIFKTFF
ncbi:hypothetical protein SRABI96_00845 [Peribacillus sp. Bi96]|nr:hypothetical protein SRABI96_00845 [Peribacillus sp. Bi96]